MKQQLKELLETCDPEVLWFDGEWCDWYTEEDGRDVYAYLRKLKPQLIINNRVGKGRKGMEGLNKGDQEYAGDFGTPEQQIPATGLPGVDWESCMTMNDTWGFKSDDHNWKSSRNADPQPDRHRLQGRQLPAERRADRRRPDPRRVRRTAAGHGPLDEGQRRIDLRHAGQPVRQDALGPLHAEEARRRQVRGCTCTSSTGPRTASWSCRDLANKPLAATLLDGGKKLEFAAADNGVTIQLPAEMPDKIATVVALDIEGDAQIAKINPYEDETPEQRDARMKWWREARFGMFIHWGVYSVPAGTYKGKQIGGIGEWIMNNGKIPVAEYKQFAKQFNPVKYDADQWVQLAKEAGMKYIVITSKHHDGFAMFDSKATDWNIVDATPFGRDPLKELAEACQQARHQAGLLLLPGPGLEPSRRRGGRRALGQGPGRQHGRVHPQDRRAAGPRDPDQLRRHRRACGGTRRWT